MAVDRDANLGILIGGISVKGFVARGGFMEGRPVRLRCDFTIGDAVLNVLIWIILIVITFGLAAFVFPYYLPKAVVNKTRVVGDTGREIGRLECSLTLGAMIGNAIIWLILTVLTFGLAYFVYIYRVFKIVLSETRIVYD